MANSNDSELTDSLDNISVPGIRSGCVHLDKSLSIQSVEGQFVGRPRGTASRHSYSGFYLKRPAEKNQERHYTTFASIARVRHSTTPVQLSPFNSSPRPSHPVIQVTVVPNNTAETQTRKFRKRKPPKRLKSAASNPDLSVKAKNVYLVVVGKQKEKVYELQNQSGAEEFSSIYDDSLDQASEISQLLKSLDMDKKKKKAKKKESSIGSLEENNVGAMLRECFCPGNYLDYGNDVGTKKSRIRISGRLGLTPDDRYVLNCAASVDDQPVETHYMQATPAKRDPESTKTLKDSIVQTNMESEHLCVCKETQCSQANAASAGFLNIERARITANDDQPFHHSYQNETVRVVEHRNDLYNPNEAVRVIEHGNDLYNQNDKRGPLVLISVYANKNLDDKVDNAQIHIKPELNSRSPSKPMAKQTASSRQRTEIESNKQTMVSSRQRSETESHRNFNRSLRNRSPSPQRNINRQKTEPETRPQRPNNTRGYQSPVRSPISNRIPGQTGQPKIKMRTQGTNTDHAKTKKALVESYTKNIAERLEPQKETRRTLPTSDISNVSVNIDAENEYYDVLFHHGERTADLRVRKTLKEQASKKYLEADDGSLQNLMFVHPPIGYRKRSVSRSYMDDRSVDLPKHVSSLLNVRDSIEISHRREEKGPSFFPYQSTTSYSIPSKDNINESGTALSKHYRGDDCNVCDPVERDKEIRELLGIRRGKIEPEVGSARAAAPNRSFSPKNTEERIIKTEASVQTFEPQCKTIFSINSHAAKKRFKLNTSCSESKNSVIGISDNSIKLPHIKRTKTSQVNARSVTMVPTKLNPDEKKIGIQLSRANGDTQNGCSRCKSLFPIHSSIREEATNLGDAQCSKINKQPTFYRQLVLNRNINMFLQIEQFVNEKPIVLTRQQYEKVKRTIELTKRMKVSGSKSSSFKRNSFTLTDVRTNRKEINKNKSTQYPELVIETIGEDYRNIKHRTFKFKKSTKDKSHKLGDMSYDKRGKIVELTEIGMQELKEKSEETIHEKFNSFRNRMSEKVKQEHISEYIAGDVGGINDCSFVSSHLSTSSPNDNVKIDSEDEILEKSEVLKDDAVYSEQNCDSPKQNSEIVTNEHNDSGGLCPECCNLRFNELCNSCGNEVQAAPPDLASEKRHTKLVEERNIEHEVKNVQSFWETSKDLNSSRQTSSSLKVHYASLSYMKNVVLSTTNVKKFIKDTAAQPTNSIQMIFRRHRRPVSPNLGTSGLSLTDGLVTPPEEQKTPKPKKPFLRRLVSCFVMRSKASAARFSPQQQEPSIRHSSVDSYRISTCLGVELSSSIYDTSASFYSNHTILPTTCKMRKGFLTSVRGLLKKS